MYIFCFQFFVGNIITDRTVDGRNGTACPAVIMLPNLSPTGTSVDPIDQKMMNTLVTLLCKHRAICRVVEKVAGQLENES